MGRKPVIRHDISCPSCGGHHVVKCGKSWGRQKFLCSVVSVFWVMLLGIIIIRGLGRML
ncbi:hypothetical protein J5U21_00733 [Saccharolobus shibatae]|uniref:Uncharacterized protein n=1 Tax=Saccharolobus shibatae TaxID=2286 RepID=A0A8F5BTC8_9CREN|nr:hypothetical protein J5U21_00733 [Saccharolobus shibatae]